MWEEEGRPTFLHYAEQNLYMAEDRALEYRSKGDERRVDSNLETALDLSKQIERIGGGLTGM